MSHPRKQKQRLRIFLAVGLVSLLPYLYALRLQNLRENTTAFLYVFFASVALYTLATLIALRLPAVSRTGLAAVFGLAILIHAILIFTQPALSDDMYRYIWDGRVQAQGISPYQYAPNMGKLRHLRDSQIWVKINRKPARTVYPPAAEMAFALLWRIVPDSVRWFQVVMSASALVAGVLLLGLLKDLGRPLSRVVIYLWSPLLAFEVAHSAHVDALVLPLVVGAWWARVRERDTLVGILLGLATVTKFYPALLLPALWRPDHPRARWRMPLAFVATVFLVYLPYWITSGWQVFGFLPTYVREMFNESPVIQLLWRIFRQLDLDPRNGIVVTMLVILAAISLWMLLKPASDGETAVRRSIWLIGTYTLFNYNLFSWYLLWLLPLVAIFLQPAPFHPKQNITIAGLKLDAWTGWWLFCSLVGLSYSFFINWKHVQAVTWLQYLPLYIFLLIDLSRNLRLQWLSRKDAALPTG